MGGWSSDKGVQTQYIVESITAVDNIMVWSATWYSQVGTLADVDGWCDPRRQREILDCSANNHILIDSYAVDKA